MRLLMKSYFQPLTLQGRQPTHWTNDISSLGLPSSGTGNIPSFTAINSSTTPIAAQLLVIPTFTNGGISCEELSIELYNNG